MRTIGSPSDPFYSQAARVCNATKHGAFTSGQCPNLIECVLNNIPQGYSAGMQAGGNIASLVPTTLALIGAPPLELVQLGLISPHRAVATCCFSIGLPIGLFRQLRPIMKRLSDRDDKDPKKRDWTIVLPVAGAGQARGFWALLGSRVAVDTVTLALAAVMLWYNWTLTSATMVTWRCEYGWLLFCWPMACIMWLLIAMILLAVLLDSIEVRYSSRPGQVFHGLAHVFLLPYRMKSVPAARGNTVVVDALESPATQTKGAAPAHGNDDRPVTPASVVFERVSITMIAHSAYGLRSWGWYEAALETLAVGIYLYATFVLTSSLFLTGEMAINYAVCMTLSLSGIRILGSIA